MIPGTIRLFGLWVVLALMSTPGILMISSVSYGLSLPVLSGISESFWRGAIEMSSLKLAFVVAAGMTLKLCMWFICYRRTFRWAAEALRIRRDIKLVQDSGLVARIRTNVAGPLLTRHSKLVDRLNKWTRGPALPVSMAIVPFSGTASIGSLLIAAANAERQFAILAAVNFASVFTATLCFRQLVLAKILGL